MAALMPLRKSLLIAVSAVAALLGGGRRTPHRAPPTWPKTRPERRCSAAVR